MLFSQTFRVELLDTDASGRPQMASWIRWMEETEYGFLRSLGLSVSMHDERGQYGFPRQRAAVEVLRPVGFGDELRVGLELGPISHKQVLWRFRAWSPPGDESQQSLVATGEFLVACCRFPKGRLPVAILIPDQVLEKIQAAGDPARS